MNGIDHHDQMCKKYDVGHFSVKAWKYILWYFVNTSIVNAYIFYCKTSTRQTKKKYVHLDFWLEIVMGLIVGFSSRKRKAEAPLYIRPVTAANKNNYENVHMGWKKGKRCKQQMRKEIVYGCCFWIIYACVKMDAILPTIIKDIKLLFIFFIFETSLDVSPELFMSIVRLI